MCWRQYFPELQVKSYKQNPSGLPHYLKRVSKFSEGQIMYVDVWLERLREKKQNCIFNFEKMEIVQKKSIVVIK